MDVVVNVAVAPIAVAPIHHPSDAIQDLTLDAETTLAVALVITGG